MVKYRCLFSFKRQFCFFISVKLREKKYGASKQQEKQEKKETKDEETQDEGKQDDADEGRKPFLENNNPRYDMLCP